MYKEAIPETGGVGVTTVDVSFLWRRSRALIRFQKGGLIPNAEAIIHCV